MTDSREFLRTRRDTCLVHFSVAMLVGVGMAAVWEIPGDGVMAYARVAAAVTFVASWAYGVVAWCYGASAHWRLRQLR